jgi:fibronectin type 3 domain-containing protein
VHDYRFLQKLGPFNIAANDSIRVVFAFGIGDGLSRLRSNLNNARLLFENDYVYFNLPPDSPNGLRATDNGYDFILNWTANTDDAIGYNVYYSEAASGPFSRANSVPIDTAYYLFSPGGRHLYYFYVTAEDGGHVESTPSNVCVASTLPDPPPNLHAFSGSDYIRLSWDTVEEASYYQIYRATTQGGPYQMIGQIMYQGLSFDDSNVVQHQSYYYVATTTAWGYESPYSGEIRITFDPAYNGRVLLVDDYGETDDNGQPLLYQEMRRIYERWGVHHFDYDLWVIADQGMPDAAILGNYQAVVFASDADMGQADMTWWYDVGSIGGGVLRYYLEHGGHLMAIGSMVIPWVYNTNPPSPGDFEYDWFGVDSVNVGGVAWDYANEFSWAIGQLPGYPDSMKIDVAKNGDQLDYDTFIYSLRPDATTLFTEGLDVYGDEPSGYGLPIALLYRPGGVAKTCLISFDLHNMPNPDINTIVSNVLRDEFGCVYYQDPAPLPPWRLTVTSLGADTLFIGWDAADESDIVAVRLYRSGNGQPFEMISSMPPDASQYFDTDIAPGTSYSYKMTSVDFAGQEGPFSNSVTEFGGRPPAPDSLRAQVDFNSISLSWQYNPGPDIAGIRIYRRIGYNGGFSQLAQVGAGDEAYQDNDVVSLRSHFYYLTAVDTFGFESYPSDTAFAFYQGAEVRSGILIVNGCDWNTYNPEIYDMYQSRALTGDYSYSFWDLFHIDNSQRPYPETVIGDGPLNPGVLDTFGIIIWVGNNYSGDYELWQEQVANLINYLNSGGNLFLLCRYGSDFLSTPFRDYAHITEFDIGLNPDSLIAVAPPFVNIRRIGSQSLTDFVMVDTYFSQVLFRPSNYFAWTAGFRSHPQGHGQFAYLAGRAYRWNYDDLRANCMAVLDSMGAVGIEDNVISLPDKYELYQNYPNPFNPTTTIRFGLPRKSDVRLVIYDILGREIRRLVDRRVEAGYGEIIWDGKNERGSDVGSGVYFYRLQAEGVSISRKMVMLK